MRTLLTRRAGQDGTKKLQEQWGDDLVCVRYRYDDVTNERVKTVEIVIERVPWRQTRKRSAPSTVHVRIARHEELLRRAVLFAGGKWDERTDTWSLPREAAVALGMADRATKHARNGARDLQIDRKRAHHL